MSRPEVSPQILEQISKVWDSQLSEFDYDLEVVEGSIPEELQGTLFRNGPGAMETQGTPLVHPIDGDGMICSIRFSEGKAHFRSHYVNTEMRELEKKEQKMIAKCLMGSKPVPTWSEAIKEWSTDVMSGRLPNTRFKNPSNTNVFYWGGKLLSCWELGYPYLLNPHTLETIGKETLGGALAGNMGAHFRYDAEKDRMVVFSLNVPLSDESPKVTFYEFDKDWNLIQNCQYSLDGFYYCHDFMMTENYYIVHQTPFVNPSKREIAQIVTGWAAPGQLMGLKEGLPSRILLIPRYPENSREVKPFDIFPCHIFHHINAFEQDSSVHFTSVCIGEKMTMEFEDRVWLSNASEAPGHVYDFHIEMDKSRVTWKRTDDSSCEFPTAHPDLSGKSWRYAYLMAAESGHRATPYQEIVKYDRLQQGRQVWSARTEKAIITEPIFVPRQGVNLPEDDGWVITQVFHYETQKSQFVVLDAKDLTKGPIARIGLSHHTPFGFHGTFTHEIY